MPDLALPSSSLGKYHFKSSNLIGSHAPAWHVCLTGAQPRANRVRAFNRWVWCNGYVQTVCTGTRLSYLYREKNIGSDAEGL